MSWQDFLFSFGGVILSVMMLPMIRDTQKPPIKTALAMAVILTAYAVAEWTLALFGASVFTSLQIAAWVILGVQRWKQKHGPKTPEVLLLSQPADFIYRSFQQRGAEGSWDTNRPALSAELISYLRASNVDPGS